MPLTQQDRAFLHSVDRMKVYLLVLAVAVLAFLLMTPPSEVHMATAVIGVALCGVFWLTQRLLTYITLLDVELTRIMDAVKRSLPEEERGERFGQ